MTWDRGRDEIQRLIDQGEIDQVVPNAELADRYMKEAGNHIDSARSILRGDPSGSYDLAYDAARKACVALLAVQGLRPTSRGGHVAVGDAVRAQFGTAFHSFDRLRRERNRSQYPDALTPTVTEGDAMYAIEAAEKLIDGAQQLLASGRIDGF